MLILILGGTSWLGGEVARVALARGHGVTCLARGESGQAPPGATFVRADRGEDTAYDQVCGRDWGGVVDASWQPGFVRGAVTALAGRAGTWVYVSSCSVYAAHDTIGADEAAELLPALEGGEATMASYGEAKVACERAVLGRVGSDRAVIVRSGLIGGQGDRSGRTGYWPMRFAHPATEDGAVLVPDCPDLATQVIHVSDLAAWLVHCIEERVHGIFNACGPVTRFADHLDAARRVASHTGRLVTVSDEWLDEHEVDPGRDHVRCRCGCRTTLRLASGAAAPRPQLPPGSSADPWSRPSRAFSTGRSPKPWVALIGPVTQVCPRPTNAG